jgi:hypothetical protein
MDSDRLRQAVIQWECQQHLNKVIRLTDQQEWERLAMCYTEDAVLARPSDPNHPIVGREAILASFRARPPRITAHILGNSVFELVKPGIIKVVSSVWLVSGLKTEADMPVKADSEMLVGTFKDQLVSVEGNWLISRRDGSIELKYGE